MNTKYIYLLASSVLLLAAGCTDEDGNGKEEPQPGLKRDAYTSVTIKLPTVSGTKAAPAYDPGTAEEYAVKDLTLLFFRKPDEGSTNEEDFVLSDVISTVQGLSTTSGVLAVTLPTDGGGGAGAVSKTFSTGAISIDKSSVRVLALLNVEKVTGLAAAILKIGHSFKMINEAVQLVDISHLSGDQFLMLSAPLWKNGTMSTLTTIEPKTSREDAEKAPVTIDVERAVAKVNLKAGNAYQDDGGTFYFTVADGNHRDDKITILGWELGNTNTYVYPFRKVNTTWASDPKYAALWGAGSGGALVSGTRLHWAEDPNYSEANWAAATFQSPSSIGNNTDWAGAAKYCLENTCDYQYMYKPQVTRVIVKAKYIPNTTNQDGGNNTVDEDGETWWSFTSVAAHYSAKNMYLKIMGWMHDKLSGSPEIPANVNDITLSNGNLTATGGDWTITLSAATGSTSHFDLASVSYTSGGASTAVDATTINAFKSGMGQIQKYDKGICYYDIFIRHFTNEEGGYSDTWTNTGGYEPAQLGRYGVVRNNWYIVTINSITQPGEPDIPTDPNLPVDTESAYINCTIQLAAWAKREHEIDL